MKRAGPGFVEPVKTAVIVVLCFLFAPLIAAGLGVENLRQRPLVRRFAKDRVDDLRVVADDLVITRGGAIESVPLADITGGAWTIVDYGGAFADANECGLLFDFQRARGEPLHLALKYHDPHHTTELIRPLIARGLLPGEARHDNITGSFKIAVVTMLVAAWILAALIVVVIWIGWLR
jgi:hypothetical protein